MTTPSALSNHSVVQRFSESSQRHLGVSPRRAQINAAFALLESSITEMATGEGKTLAIALGAALFANQNKSVLVATANNYLAARDAAWMRPVLQSLSIAVSAVPPSDLSKWSTRAAHYESKITYGTLRDFGFDYLRCCIEQRSSKVKMPRFPFDVLIVDEADSVLIDEARTPLVISEPDHQIDYATESCFRWSACMANSLQVDDDYKPVAGESVALTDNGHRKVIHSEMPSEMDCLSTTEIVHSVERALWVRDSIRSGQHYIVRGDQVCLVDEFTGRASRERAMGSGIQQAIQALEGISITPSSQPIARITVQDFVSMFGRTSGITATAAEDAEEFRQVYGLEVKTFQPFRPNQLHQLPSMLCSNEAERWQLILDETESAILGGRAVLIGTRTVTQSETLSAKMNQHGISHQVLNAREEANEAGVITTAGQVGSVTIATNMAGRGTHIPLSDEVEDSGGLHVIVAEPNLSQRIDRQLIGRAARQGAPGSARVFVCIRDEVVQNGLSDRERDSLANGSNPDIACVDKAIQKAQSRESQRQRDQRRMLLAVESARSLQLQSLGLDPVLDPLPSE